MRQFDDKITARYSGFTGADDYYDRASSSRVASQIAVPALILHALDDPFIRMLPSTRGRFAGQSPGAADRDRAWRSLRVPGAGGRVRRLLGGEDAAGLSALGHQTLMEADWSVALAGRRPGDHRSLGRVWRRHPQVQIRRFASGSRT